MTKKIILAVLAVAVIAFLSITVYKAYFEDHSVRGDEKKEVVEDEEDEECIDPMVECDVCNVEGNIPGHCPICKGTGIFGSPTILGDMVFENDCPICLANKGVCYNCGGTGRIPKSKVGKPSLPSIPPTAGSHRIDTDDKIECAICHGTGKCTHCGGDGELLIGDSYTGYERRPCEECIQGGQCKYCFGRGYNYK